MVPSLTFSKNKVATFDSFIKKMNEDICNDEDINQFIKSFKFSSEQFNIFCITLTQKPNLSNLDFCSKDLDVSMVKRIVEVLKSTALISLNLSSNEALGSEGALVIAEILTTNKALETLNLSLINMGSNGYQALAEALKHNKTLLELDLGGNSFDGKKAVDAIKDILKNNRTLSSLSAGTSYDSVEIYPIVEALKENSVITSFEVLLDYRIPKSDQMKIKSEIDTVLERNRLLYLNRLSVALQEATHVLFKTKDPVSIIISYLNSTKPSKNNSEQAVISNPSKATPRT